MTAAVFRRCCGRRLPALGLALLAHLAAAMVVLAHIGPGTMRAGTQAEPDKIMQLALHPSAPPQFAPSQQRPPAVKKREARPVMPPMRPVAPVLAQAAMPPDQSASADFSLPLPEARYYRAGELTVRPQLLEDIPAHFQIEGVPAQKVILRLFIGKTGEIDRVAVEQSFLPQAMVEQLTDAFSRLRFRPGLLDDTAVRTQMKIEVSLEQASVMP